jgi:anti-anti-sigma factor
MKLRPEIRVDSTDGCVTVLELLGEHDMASIDELRIALEEAMRQSRVIVVDLSQAEFIDSGVIHALFETSAVLEARGNQLVLQIEGNNSMLHALEITKLTAVAVVTEDREQAIAAATAQP